MFCFYHYNKLKKVPENSDTKFKDLCAKKCAFSIFYEINPALLSNASTLGSLPLKALYNSIG